MVWQIKYNTLMLALENWPQNLKITIFDSPQSKGLRRYQEVEKVIRIQKPIETYLPAIYNMKFHYRYHTCV